MHNLCRYCADEQDSVRLLAVEDCAALGRLLPKEECVFEAGFRVGLVFLYLQLLEPMVESFCICPVCYCCLGLCRTFERCLSLMRLRSTMLGHDCLCLFC